MLDLLYITSFRQSLKGELLGISQFCDTAFVGLLVAVTTDVRETKFWHNTVCWSEHSCKVDDYANYSPAFLWEANREKANFCI